MTISTCGYYLKSLFIQHCY